MLIFQAAISQYTVVVIIAGIMRNIADIAPYLPKGKNPKAAEFKQGTDEMLDARLELGTERKDIFTHLLVGDKETGTKFTRGQLDANARLVIIAGTGKRRS